MSYSDLQPLLVPIQHSVPPPSSVCPCASIRKLKKGLVSPSVPPHGTPSKHHYSAGGRLLLKETTIVPTLMSNWPFLPPPTSFFNIQIGCFVPLNWRLIAHTIWRRLFKKTVAFFLGGVAVIKVRD